jgi:hypothetical protein
MIITRKHLPRRTFLRGLGTAIALPMLDAMAPALAAPARIAGKAPTRLSFTYIPQGAIMQHWTPKGTGKDFEFTRILKALEPFREQTLVLSGLMDHNGNALGDGGGDHARLLARRRDSLPSNWGSKICGQSAIAIRVTVALTPTASRGAARRRPCRRRTIRGRCSSGCSARRI